MTRARPRVLIADDNLEMARTIAEGLSDRGYETVAAGGGRQAVEVLASNKLDAIVTDLRMPDVDGMAVLAAARRIDSHRPVIVMTAFSAIDSAIESIRQGAYHYLTKPFKLDELTIFLQRGLEDHQLRQEAAALKLLLASCWRGNRDELAAAVERAVLLTRGGEAGQEDSGST
jgi:two-component system response regulator HydG